MYTHLISKNKGKWSSSLVYNFWIRAKNRSNCIFHVKCFIIQLAVSAGMHFIS